MQRGLLLLLCVGFTFGQINSVFSIDDFSVSSPSLIIISPDGGVSSPISINETVTGAVYKIIGRERDLQLTMTSGSGNLVATASVTQDDFYVSFPNSASGYSLLQYDGPDGSMNLNPSGLGKIDFTTFGGYALHTFIRSDLATNVKFSLFSGSVYNVCNRTLNIPGNNENTEYYVDFSSFSGACDFTSIGAVEVSVFASDNIDLSFSSLDVVAPLPSSSSTTTPFFRPPSASHTPTPTPTPTPTRTTYPSSSNTPTCTPTPTRTPHNEGKYACCLYYSKTENYESAFCQKQNYLCPPIYDFYPVTNETVSSCSDCYGAG